MTYSISVKRSAAHRGWLEYKVGGEIKVATECWWDDDNRIRPGEYVGCATRMANKNDGFDGGKREAILMHRKGAGAADHKLYRYRYPQPNDETAHQIFIHKDLGLKEQASDGCIVCNQAAVQKIWNLSKPREKYVIDVVIDDITESWKRSSERGERQA